MQSMMLHQSASARSLMPRASAGQQQRHCWQQQQQQQWQQQRPASCVCAVRPCSQPPMQIAAPAGRLHQKQPAHSRQPVLLAATGSDQPQASAKQQPQGRASQPQQPSRSSGAGAASQQQAEQEEAEEWDSDDEAEGEEEYDELEEGEWDEDEDWEDEEEEEDAGSALAPAGKQIPLDQKTVEFTQDDFVEVGLISRPHGVRGEVKVQLITDEPKKRLGTAGKRLWLQALPARSGLVPPSVAAARGAGGGNPFKTLRRVVVQSGRVARPGAKGQREEWAVKFQGYDSRGQAADLAGHKLLLALCDREARPRGRDLFFVDQLVGLKANDAASGTLLGIVTEVYDNGASYSLLRVRLAPEEEDIAASRYRSVLVPFVTDIVPNVDLPGGSIGLALPEGLLETASTTKLRKAYTPEQQAQLREQLKKRRQQQREWQQQQQGQQ